MIGSCRAYFKGACRSSYFILVLAAITSAGTHLRMALLLHGYSKNILAIPLAIFFRGTKSLLDCWFTCNTEKTISFAIYRTQSWRTMFCAQMWALLKRKQLFNLCAQQCISDRRECNYWWFLWYIKLKNFHHIGLIIIIVSISQHYSDSLSCLVIFSHVMNEHLCKQMD